MELISSIYDTIGSLICHQLPSRTIYIDGIPLPLCARDTGIYLGIFISLMYVILRKRLDSDEMPDLRITIILSLAMLPMMIDGLGSYIGIWETNNVIRLFTGIFFGLPIPIFLLPASNYKVEGTNKKRIIGSWSEILLIAALSVIFCLILLYSDCIPWFFASTVLIFSFIFLIGRIVYTIIARTEMKNSKYKWIILVIATVGIFSMLFTISNYIFKYLRNSINGLG